jgi:hypothetical protein
VTPPDSAGPVLCVLLLDGARLEIAGAVADPRSFSAPTRYRVVPGASGAVVASPEFEAVAGEYIDTACAAVAAGATMLTSNCGFAIAYQDAVRAAARVPTALSSLLLVPLLHRVYGERLGILTFDATQLDDERRRLSGWPPGVDLPIADVQHSAAWRALNAPAGAILLDDQMRTDLVETSRNLVSRHDVSALLLECTGFCPFATDVARCTGLPVYDVVGLTSFLLAGGRPATVRSGQEVTAGEAGPSSSAGGL